MESSSVIERHDAREARRAPLRVLHLADLALRAGRPSGPTDPAERDLTALLDDLQHLPALDLVVVSGDVTADRSSKAYATARRLVGAIAARHGVPHVYALGDRDDHDRFGEVLGSGHLGPDHLDYGDCGPAGELGERHGWVSDVDGLRVVTLDTTVAGAPHGVLGDDQAQWLDRVLSDPAPRGTLLVQHHPPVAPAGFGHLAERGLRDADRLAEVVSGSDVLVVLTGGLRVPMSAALAGVPVIVAPGAVDRTDLSAPVHLDRVVEGGAALVVEISSDGALASYPVHARRPHDRVTLTDPRTGSAVADEQAAPSRPGTSDDAHALGTRIPAGESPPPPLVGADRPTSQWPAELDSSSRSVAPEPTYDIEPVWLDAAAPAEPSDAESSGVLSWAFERSEISERPEPV